MKSIYRSNVRHTNVCSPCGNIDVRVCSALATVPTGKLSPCHSASWVPDFRCPIYTVTCLFLKMFYIISNLGKKFEVAFLSPKFSEAYFLMWRHTVLFYSDDILNKVICGVYRRLVRSKAIFKSNFQLFYRLNYGPIDNFMVRFVILIWSCFESGNSRAECLDSVSELYTVFCFLYVVLRQLVLQDFSPVFKEFYII